MIAIGDDTLVLRGVIGPLDQIGVVTALELLNDAACDEGAFDDHLNDILVLAVHETMGHAVRSDFIHGDRVDGMGIQCLMNKGQSFVEVIVVG